MKSGGWSEILNSYENMSDPQPVSQPNFLKHVDDKYMKAKESITDDALEIFGDVEGFHRNILIYVVSQTSGLTNSLKSQIRWGFMKM